MEKDAKVTRFSRFYATLNRLPYPGDQDDLKRELVSQATHGRTEHLREMTRKEYDSCCRVMETFFAGPDPISRGQSNLKHKRSIALHLMKDIGVDTTDWNVINKFCKSNKIAGKPFRELSPEDLDEMAMRLRMILKKKERL